MKIDIKKGHININVHELLRCLENEDKAVLLEIFTIDELLPAIEAQLKGQTSSWGWSTDGTRDGSAIRELVLKMQGLEPEYKKDLESMANKHKHDAEHYKKYYDWFFRLYHCKGGDNEPSLFDRVVKAIGTINV